MQKTKVAITATFTSESIEEVLRYLLTELRVPVEIEFAPYSQVFQELIDPSGLMSGNLQGVNIVLVRFEDWSGPHGTIPPERRAIENVERNVLDFIEAVKLASFRSSTPYLVCLCHSSKSSLGVAEVRDFFQRMEDLVESELSQLDSVYVLFPRDIEDLYPGTTYDDPAGNRLAHIPYTQEYFAALGGILARRIYALKSAPRKVVVLDCDNTLWKGVCGEVGAEGVEIDAPHKALQSFMVAQTEFGKVLCLCSKNNEEDVFQVFDLRPEMSLKRDHILAWRINWDPKSKNLKALSEELQVGLESFIFVDDDPVVCAEVRANCPEVLTLQLPADALQIPHFLKHTWAFDHLKSTCEDERRTQLYRENVERERLRGCTTDFADFISGLGLEIDITEMRESHLARVAQLTQRTNQFNFTTIRRSEQSIRQIYSSGTAECQVVEVRDRFGDYGLVGAIIFGTNGSALEVDTFLLSCRALGRGVEHRMLAKLGEIASDRKLSIVQCRLIVSKKNRPALEFLQMVGGSFTEEFEDGFCVSLPAEYAASVVFDAGAGQREAQDNAALTKPVVLPALSLASGSDNLALTRIANELDSAERILRGLRRQNDGPVIRRSTFTAPRDQMEVRLASIWEDTLAINPIGIDDDFFELGGDSLGGVRLFSEIETAFNHDLSMALLFEAPTIRELAKRLRGDVRSHWTAVVPVKPEGTRPPLFCMHAAGGHVLFYRDLASYLPPDQPVYGLQARGLDKRQTHHERVEDMAAYYLDEIRAVQPHGPYYLAGSSFGGLVAFEMAQQLKRQGEEVGLLALFDTYGPCYPRFKPGTSLSRKIYGLAGKRERVVDNLRSRDMGGKVAYLLERASKLGKLARRKILWRRNEFAIRFNAATGRALPIDLQRNHKAIDKALQSYRPQLYKGRMTLFRASKQPHGAIPDLYLGWKPFVPNGIEVHEVRGAHGAVTVEPYARFLAAKLIPCLENAQRSRVTAEPVPLVPYQFSCSQRELCTNLSK